jgi:hypothetical protein
MLRANEPAGLAAVLLVLPEREDLLWLFSFRSGQLLPTF